MEITLPIQKVKIVNGKKLVESSEKVFELDMTLAAQMRFEQKFPEIAKREDLYDYTKRILSYSLSREQILSLLKTLYCWFDTNIQFIEFIKLFDFSDKQYVDKLLQKLDETFKIIFDSPVEKN